MQTVALCLTVTQLLRKYEVIIEASVFYYYSEVNRPRMLRSLLIISNKMDLSCGLGSIIDLGNMN